MDSIYKNNDIETLRIDNQRLRKKLQQLERERETLRKTKFIANVGDELLTMIDRSYVYESVKPAYCRARGQRQETLIGKSVAEVWGQAEFDQMIRPRLDNCFDGNATSYEKWFEFDGKDKRCYQVTFNPYLDDDGRVTHAVVATHDITERKNAEAGLEKAKERLENRVRLRTAELEQANDALRRQIEERERAEKALRESENRYRSVSRDMPAMVCRFLPDGSLTFANIRFKNHFSISDESLLTTNIFEFFPKEEQNRMKRRLLRLSPTHPMETYEQNTVEQSGEIRWRQWTDRAMFDENGAPMEYQSVSIDITDKKSVEGKLQQAQKMEAVGTLAGGIAHDFNNLLMGIQGNLSLMYMDIDHTHRLYDNIHIIEQLVESGATLTRQLLGFARGGKYVVKAININDVISETASLFGRTRKSIRIHEVYDANMPMISADRGQIEQVLINLYLNAWQAMSEQGELYLKTENVTIDDKFLKPFVIQYGEYVRVSVTDTGKGIDPRISHRIFDPFFTTKEIGCGSGLGLASVFGIVKNHGGIIDFESNPGHGTTFFVYFPLTEETASTPKTQPKMILKGPETILLVDDERYVMEVGEKMLVKMGYTVLTACCGEEAVRIFADACHRIDLVILDRIMSDIGGEEVFDRIRKIKQDILVLWASGYGMGNVANPIESGREGFIQKPFGMEELSHAIRQLIDNEHRKS